MSARLVEMATLREVSVLTLPCHHNDNGDLVVIEGSRGVPFAIARVFIVRADPGAVRGQHAHKACSQFFTCAYGAVEVECDDGTATVTYRLDRPDKALLLPPGIWSQQTYIEPGTTLTVLCDRPYETADYIRDYDEFKAYRQTDHARDS
jgi:dTDP-4-dehydrorhamnose 3,5-epimerase-like enzyme